MNEPSQILTPEEKLLVALCRMSFNNEQRTAIRDMMKDVSDWNSFVERSNEHGIIALCWHNITETGNSEYIPAPFLEKLHSGYLKSLTRNTFLFNMLDDVISHAKKENIKIVLLKGIALEKTVFGNKGLRQMNDLDILVMPEQALQLRKLFLNNGFESTPLISPLYENNLFPDGKHLPELRKSGVSVEIHFKLFRQKGNSLTGELFDNAYCTTNENDHFYPEPRLFFLYLVKHLDNHEKEGSSQLRLYADLAVMLEMYADQIVNQELFNDAGKANIESALKEKLKILEIFWGVSYPEWVLSYLQEIETAPVTEKFIRFLRHPDDNNLAKGPYNPLVTLKYIPGIKNKILFVTGYACPSFKYMKAKYNTRTFAGTLLYYPLRWIHISGWIGGIRGKV